MAFATIRKAATKLKAQLATLTRAEDPILTKLRRDPTLTMKALGLRPDPWQIDLLQSRSQKLLILASRQAGKSRTTACLGTRSALLTPKSTTLIVSPSERQSAETLRKCREVFDALGRPLAVTSETMSRLEFSNGARILAVPSSGETIRCFALDTLICDEASRIPDALFDAVSPMLAVSGGRMILLSSPCGKRGLFYEEWASPHKWERIKITADQCPRIKPEFLASERERMTLAIYMQEYFCEFQDAEGAVFRGEDIEAAFRGEFEPYELGI